MQEDYRTILATCMRLKESALKNMSLIMPNILYQSLQPLFHEVGALVNALPDDFASQKQFLSSDSASCVMGQGINIYGLGLLVRDLDNLNVIINSCELMPKKKVSEDKGTCKKVFISHSSRDKAIVDAFVTLLTRGGGLSQNDIFCTSIDGMKIKNGEDLRKHIQTNVNFVDFAILLVSRNYKESEICLNEMGAVWAIDKKIKAYVFPDLEEERVGWLINDKAAEKLNDITALTSLYEELLEFYHMPSTFAGWIAQAKAFCEKFQ
ncbi:MAG: toll/interleukin-1 receptor domain-containing protein [Victivallales bacterium]|nr:toll/interleukin-1 receptor domain-containing protein [Victivallales bacterium]